MSLRQVYTTNQILFAEYLLKNIGFTNQNKIDRLLTLYLERFKYYERYTETVSLKNNRGQTYKTYNAHKSKERNSTIDVLLSENEMRRKLGEIELMENNNSKYISASDIGTFVFCRASYTISKSFIIEHSFNKTKIENGNEFHEQLRLIYKKEYFGFKKINTTGFTTKQKIFLKKINKCRLVYKGHEETPKTFFNKEKNYIAQPDYIFQDPNNDYFVVEEKYHYKDKREKENDGFYLNNFAQLQSYVDYIKDYDIKYGVLVNWYYDFDEENGIIKVYDFNYKVIRNQYSDLAKKTLDEIKKFKKNKKIDFENNVNINKCFNCSAYLYCAHKTDNFEELQLPYNRYHLNLKKIKWDNFNEQ